MVKQYLVTGTSSGFGRVMTERLLERGDSVVATVRQDGALDDLVRLHGDRLSVELLDITDTSNMRAVVDRAFESNIDVVVSNAGYGLFGAAEELSDREIDRQIATNLTGSIQLIRAVLPHMRRQQGGRIVQVSSEGGQIAYPAFSLYHATKWGIEGFVQSVAQEVALFGIDFILVEPGPTGTDFKTGLSIATPMTAYDATPAADVRRNLANGTFGVLADVAKSVDAMIDAMDAQAPALRLALGSNAYTSISRGLAERSEALERQKGVALMTDGAC